MDAAFCARVERCVRVYVEWEIHILKWMKLNELERRVKKLGTSGVVEHLQLGRQITSSSPV